MIAGGGARGAYEAGAVAALLPRLGDSPTILVGTSAGALNIAGLAAAAHHGLDQAAERVVSLWSSVTLDDVFGVLSSFAGGGLRYLAQIAGRRVLLPSLFDTTRMDDTIRRLVSFEQLHHNIERGLVSAVAVAATSIATGGTVVFVDKHPSVALPPYDANRNISYVETELRPEHVLASAAVPVLFRPIDVTTPERWAGWYVDGGLRLNMPLKPAVQLGADRLGMVATRPRDWPPEQPHAQATRWPHQTCSTPPVWFCGRCSLIEWSRISIAWKTVMPKHTRIRSTLPTGISMSNSRATARKTGGRAGGAGERRLPATVPRRAPTAQSSSWPHWHGSSVGRRPTVAACSASCSSTPHSQHAPRRWAGPTGPCTTRTEVARERNTADDRAAPIAKRCSDTVLAQQPDRLLPHVRPCAPCR